MQNQAAAVDHIKSHTNYPASKQDLVQACNNMSDFSEEDKEWFASNLPEGQYSSSDDVMKALGWSDQGMQSPPQA